MSNIVGGQVVWNLEADLSGLEDGLKEASRKVEQVSRDVGQSFKNLGSNMVGLGKDMSAAITAPLVAIGGAAFKFTEVAGRFSSVEDSFKSMTKGMGIDAQKFQKDVADATGGQLDKLTILQGATKGLSLIGKDAFNDFGQDFVRMAELSKKAARATGQDVDYMFNSLILGVSRESKLILDNLGITLDLVEVKDAYAISLGKASEELTASEEKHAVLNAVLGQLDKTYGDVKVSAGGFQGAIQQLTTLITDSSIALGKELEPEMAKFTKQLTQLIKDEMPSIIALVKNIIGWFTDLSPTMQKVIIGIVLFATVIGPVLVVLGLWISAVGGLISFISALMPVIAGVIAAIGAISAPVWIVIGVITALIAIGTYLWRNWDMIKQGAINLVESTINVFSRWRDSLISIINNVINWFRSIPDQIRGALNNIADIISRPFYDAWRSVQDIANRIKEALQNINPFHRNSPSLVDNVIAGVREIKDQYAGLGSITMPEISSQSLPLTDIESEGQSFSRKNVTVNIGEVSNAQDIEMISREIGYRLAFA